MHNPQKQNEELDHITLKKNLEGLGLMEFLAGPGGESKVNIPHSSLENIESAVSRLHNYFGWEPHYR